MNFKKILKILLVSLLAMFAIVYFFFSYVEAVFPLIPEIDTQFTRDFSKKNFELISAKMSPADVEKLLGKPFTTQGGSGYCWDGKPYQLSMDSIENVSILDEVKYLEDAYKVWSYTKDGACSWFDFAWLEYRVEFKDGVVVKTEKCWHGD